MHLQGTEEIILEITQPIWLSLPFPIGIVFRKVFLPGFTLALWPVETSAVRDTGEVRTGGIGAFLLLRKKLRSERVRYGLECSSAVECL